jgi:hypothetical protein
VDDFVENRRSSLEPVADVGGRAEKASGMQGVHAPSTRVTIAWPFSQIKLQEASEELKELTDLLSDLLEAMSDVVGEDRLAPLRERADSLRARLH